MNRTITFLPWLLCIATLPAQAQHFETFAEPIEQIDASIAEAGRVAAVNVRRGDRVKKGDVLMSLDTDVLDATLRAAKAKAGADAEVRRLEVEAQLRRERLAKLRELEQTGAGSVEEVTRAEADLKVAELQVENAVHDLELRKLQVEEIRARVEQRMVRSPIAGHVTEVFRDSGEYVSAHEPQVAVVVNLDRLRATFHVASALLDHIPNVGKSVELSFPESRQNATGAIEHIGAVTQADSGLVRVDVVIENPKHVYRSGARVRLSMEQFTQLVSDAARE